jgi:hypothetical protein
MLALNYLLIRSMNNKKIEAPGILLQQRIESDIQNSWDDYLKDSINSV